MQQRIGRLTRARVRYLERRITANRATPSEELEWVKVIDLGDLTMPPFPGPAGGWTLDEGEEIDAETQAEIDAYERASDHWYRTPLSELIFPVKIHVPSRSPASARSRRSSRRSHNRSRRARSPGRRKADEPDLDDGGSAR